MPPLYVRSKSCRFVQPIYKSFAPRHPWYWLAIIAWDGYAEAGRGKR